MGMIPVLSTVLLYSSYHEVNHVQVVRDSTHVLDKLQVGSLWISSSQHWATGGSLVVTTGSNQ